MEITLHGIDEETMRLLAFKAQARQVTVEEEIIEILRQELRCESREEAVAALRKAQAEILEERAGKPLTDSVALIREMREHDG